MAKVKPETPLKVNVRSVVVGLIIFSLLAIAYDAILTPYQQQIDALTAERDAAQREMTSYKQSLQTINSANAQEWDDHTQAMAAALLLTDAYLTGGMKKSNEVFADVTKYIDEATKQKDLVKDELKKYGIEPPPETATEGT